MSLGRYYHTLRHLRPVQFYGRIAHRLHRPRPDTRPAPPQRAAARPFPLPPVRQASLLGPARFQFLNVVRDLESAAGWNDPAADKLWLYNLHYFDDLNAEGRDGREAWHRTLIERWIAENPPGQGNGWEPYPISLRLVNWVKWALAGHALPPAAVQSLAVQARYLTERLEYHLLGNHLWSNGKALVFAGALFDGEAAAGWLAKGLGIVEEQLAEQVLPDGGHFERSPMYHSIFIEDLLDLVALAQCFPNLVAEATVRRWRATIAALLGWLETMTHPDGDIAFFNDAALGIAARPEVLRARAALLGIERTETIAAATDLTHLDPSGYVRLEAGDFVVIADVGPIGPDYIPGHAHADSLSFELSWRGRRVLGNSGTSCYGTGPQRERERGTAAQNTVTVDDQDSSEVWHGFRVARRARPLGLETAERDGHLVLACAHDGYTRLQGRPVHHRAWRLAPEALRVHDEITGRGEHRATGRLHVQPGIAVSRSSERSFDLAVPTAGNLRLMVEAPATLALREGFVGPEFGKLIPGPSFPGISPARCRLRPASRSRRWAEPCASCSSPTISRRRPTPRRPARTSTRSAGCRPDTR
jgi:uncharacterized heparinase superfamily protein